MGHTITGQYNAIILRWVGMHGVAPCGHLQSHSRPRPGKGGPAVGH